MLQDEYTLRAYELSEQANLLEKQGRPDDAANIRLEMQRLDLANHPDIWPLPDFEALK